MPTPDDPFIRFLASLSGQTVAFVPGFGGIDDALTSLAFYDLCERHGVAYRPLSQDGGTVVVGSLAVASSERVLLTSRRVVVLPGSISRFEDLGSGFGDSVTIFWRDRHSSRRAELQGARSQQVIRCHDLTVHLDANRLVSNLVAGSGMLTIETEGQSVQSNGDRLDIRLDGGLDRWGSPDFCRDITRSIAELVACHAEINTNSPCVAILAAQMGKVVRLSGKDSSIRAIVDDTIRQLYPDVSLTLEPASLGLDRDGSRVTLHEEDLTTREAPEVPGADLVRLKALVTAARRESQFVAQERDHLVVVAAHLQERLDAGAVSLAQSYRDGQRRAEEAERRTAERLVESERQAAEQLQAATTAAATALKLADARVKEACEAFAPSSQTEVTEAAGRQVEREREVVAAEALRQQVEREHEVVAAEALRQQVEREQKAADRLSESLVREAILQRRMADLEAAFAARTRQTLALQSALEGQRAQSFSTEGVVAQMRDLIDRRTMTADEALRDAEVLGRRLDAVLSSTSWRVLRPLRGVARLLQRLTGMMDGAQRG